MRLHAGVSGDASRVRARVLDWCLVANDGLPTGRYEALITRQLAMQIAEAGTLATVRGLAADESPAFFARHLAAILREVLRNPLLGHADRVHKQAALINALLAHLAASAEARDDLEPSAIAEPGLLVSIAEPFEGGLGQPVAWPGRSRHFPTMRC